MRELAAIAIGLMAACGGGTKPATTTADMPGNSSPVDCPSTAAVITRVLAVESETKDDKKVSAVTGDVAKRCDADKWTAEARSCLIAANSSDALKDCGYNHLTQAQQERLDKATAEMPGGDLARVFVAFNKFTEQMCACKDAACAQQVSDDMTKWAQEMSAREKNPPRMSEEDSKRAAEIGERMGKCMQVAMGAGGSTGPVAPLSVTGLDPEQGDVAGGTYVVIKGESFTSEARNAKVYFGDKEATVIRFASDGELIVEAPGGKANSTVDVKVVFDPGGELKLPKSFTYGKKKAPKKK
jgi:hypothetical protein